MVVTTSTVTVIEDVIRDGGKTTVKNVRIFTQGNFFNFLSRIKIQGIINQVFIAFESMYLFGFFSHLETMHLYLLLILACPKGLYGQNCTGTCKDTCDGCNNVNGFCDRGCLPGWKGDNCQERNAFTDV